MIIVGHLVVTQIGMAVMVMIWFQVLYLSIGCVDVHSDGNEKLVIDLHAQAYPAPEQRERPEEKMVSLMPVF